MDDNTQITVISAWFVDLDIWNYYNLNQWLGNKAINLLKQSKKHFELEAQLQGIGLLNHLYEIMSSCPYPNMSSMPYHFSAAVLVFLATT